MIQSMNWQPSLIHLTFGPHILFSCCYSMKKSKMVKWQKVSVALESYLLRRAVCGLTTKNYNRVFLSLIRNLRRDGVTAENLIRQLTEQTGESAEWPSDEEFQEAWHSKHIYYTLNNPKVVHILKRLNDTYFKSKMEKLSIEGPLTVEHILPQDWLKRSLCPRRRKKECPAWNYGKQSQTILALKLPGQEMQHFKPLATSRF